MNKQITVIAHLAAKPGLESKLEELLKNLIEPTRKEEGCINYALHRDLENAGVFYFYENWRSQQDLDQHFETPHLKQALQAVPEILAEPLKLTRLEMLA